jgi:hypothetical protein
MGKSKSSNLEFHEGRNIYNVNWTSYAVLIRDNGMTTESNLEMESVSELP